MYYNDSYKSKRTDSFTGGCGVMALYMAACVLGFIIVSVSMEQERKPWREPATLPRVKMATTSIPNATPVSTGIASTGIATWYDYDLPGAPDYSKTHFTAASRVYARGTMLEVCTLAEDIVPTRCVDVRVNDYGPEANQLPERDIDLSSAAFKQLAPLTRGLIDVQITTILKK